MEFLRKLIKLVLIISILFQVASVSVDEPIDPSTGQHYRWHWILQICIACIGIIYNGVSLWMMLLLEKSRRVQFYRINIAINAFDLFSSIERFIFPSVYLYHNGFYGGQAACQAESMSAIICSASTMGAIAGMSLIARYNLCNDTKISEEQISLYLVGCIIYAVVIALLVQYIPPPYGGSKLSPAGLYCFIDFSAFVSTPIAILTIAMVPLLFLTYNMRLIIISLRNAQALLESRGIKEVAKGHYIKMVLKLQYFVGFTLFCFTPFIIEGFYEMTSRKYLPPLGSATAELIAILLFCIINPSLFFYLNPDLRDKFFEVIGSRLVIFSRATVYRKISPTDSSSFSLDIEKGASSSNLFDYEDALTWTSEPGLREEFENHCRHHYVIENLLFLDYMQEYQSIGSLVLIMYNQIESSAADDIQLADTMKRLETKGTEIFALFIQAQSAPLEINIPDSMRLNVLKILSPNAENFNVSARMKSNKASSKKNDIRELKYPTPANDLIDVEKFVHVYDECLECVRCIIRTDIWPRFKKTKGYELGKARHSNGVGNK